MLAYSSSRPAAGTRSPSPNSMLVVIAVHIAAVAVLMSAKMDLPIGISDPPLIVDTIKPEPVPPKPVERPRPQTSNPTVAASDPIVAIPNDPLVIPTPAPLPPLPGVDAPGSSAGPAADRIKPIAATPAILLTGATELKPPYPPSKLASGEEAVLRLRLTIAPTGRVTAVEPVGRADPAFLTAARRHILAHWRYRPATSGGHGVATSLVVNLRFQLDD